MEQLWFWIISLMIALYAVLDGFDFGAGILHLFIAKTDSERRQIFSAIGPFWDGNEVWLLAAAGALLVAFPKVLAAAFSGFYMTLFFVMWTLILRGIAIEFRNHVKDSLWSAFWDVVFAAASILMPLLLGAALGNVLRGVPLDASGYFDMPLFTHFNTHTPVGILDWYTSLIGIFVLLTVTGHGAAFLAWRTVGALKNRARTTALPLWIAIAGLGVFATYATARVNPELYQNLSTAPMGWVGLTLLSASLALVFWGLLRGRLRYAFLGSSGFIMGILIATAGCYFPVMLKSSVSVAFSLNAYNAASGALELRSALIWWLIGFPLAIGYFVFLLYIHRGKNKPSADGNPTE